MIADVVAPGGAQPCWLFVAAGGNGMDEPVAVEDGGNDVEFVSAIVVSVPLQQCVTCRTCARRCDAVGWIGSYATKPGSCARGGPCTGLGGLRPVHGEAGAVRKGENTAYQLLRRRLTPGSGTFEPVRK